MFYQLLHPVRFWHNRTLSEVGELYISTTIRSIAMGVVGIFWPFYLYEQGLGIHGVILFCIVFFLSRSIFDILSAYIIALIGPKHTMMISYVLQIMAAFSLFAVGEYGWSPLYAGVTWGISNSLFYVALHVDFSKIKHSKKSGSEYSFLQIAQRMGMALGPLGGGMVAFVFGPKYIFLVALVLMFAAFIPLLLSPEPTKTHQHISFRGLPFRALRRDIFSYICLAAENNLRGISWPLFLSLFALGSSVYVKLGAISTLGLIVSIATAYVTGKLVDNKKGKLLLDVSAFLAAALHSVRAFVNSLPFAATVMIAGDIATVGYQIPYHKGLYDKVDTLPGNRITYISFLECCGSVTKLVVWIVLASMVGLQGVKGLLVCTFAVCALLSLGITQQRFKL